MSILTCFFLALIPYYASSITFNFTNITPKNSKDIILLGDAAFTPNHGISVNKLSTWVAGRATYAKPLRLWDKNSTDVASFTTSFTFLIDSNGTQPYADGLTFFLAQNYSKISNGGFFGLPFNSDTRTSTHPFVAVEFDSYQNDWDPKDSVTNNHIGDHVGININSTESIAYRNWYSNITYGKECRAVINYNADSKNLNVSFTSFKDNLPVWETGLNHTIDLKTVLPEWVIFGFSASTGIYYEQTNVKSWSFKSTQIKVNENKGLAPTKSVDQSNSPPPTKSVDPSSSPIQPPTKSVDPSSSPRQPPTKSNNVDQSSSSLPPTKSNNIDQSSRPSTATSKNIGNVGLIAGTLVLVFHYMALL